MKVIGVIPARYQSTRFPGKPLVKIQGRPMIQWVIEGARKSKLLSEVIVATDHLEIQKACEAVGCKAIMTDSELASGTDRIFQAIQGIDCDAIVNIQGDEPLIDNKQIDQLIEMYLKDTSVQMATLAHPLNSEDLENPNIVKVILDQNNDAIYFSRFAIPYSRNKKNQGSLDCYKHLGMYLYRKDFLELFCKAKPAAIELAESLEQLRALYLGVKIKVGLVEHGSIGVDTPEDLKKIEKILEEKNKIKK